MRQADYPISMLERIRIKQFALIDDLTLEFHPELNVLTGETGAGKTILIDALSAALGERLELAAVKQAEQTTEIEAVFNLTQAMLKENPEISAWLGPDDESLILRREITPDGRNKCTINGKSANVSSLREVGRFLADFHGQHDHQQLLDPLSHLTMLDRLAHTSHIKAPYQQLFNDYATLKEKREKLLALQEGRERELDLLKFQIDEIAAVDPSQDEDRTLQEEHARLANAEKIFEYTARILNLLTEDDRSAINQLGAASKALSDLAKIDESVKALLEQMTDAEIALGEAGRSIQSYHDHLSFDEDRLKEIEDRLDDLAKLKRKYGGSLQSAIEFLEKNQERYDMLAHFDEKNEELEKALQTQKEKLIQQAKRLTSLRQKTAQKLKTAIEKELHGLGIKYAAFECRIEPTEPNQDGMDRAEFFISLNAGEPLLPLVQIISGGEASRVMLAMKRALIDTDQIPTMIFDEIDANIGGRLGSVVGKKIAEIAQRHQILLITHLPQIASFANRHIKVTKLVRGKRTVTHYAVIDGEERVKELSAMFEGEKQTKIAEEHARELLTKQNT
ncbi:MAG: DNA repair protein RecN [Candidatus Omnitrophica bacterium CG11_big_fil_rev_8_21_14_0_20_45_26]|uniref:DNA repair protein RecN n=1 Tax=Candidatus Abzuiibacterium crystallinum TaxID=1974748 RepID=A0A2H0LNR4_9BACT|nr:MAG: DNA repair protein RecN [Candidatus Omnitrophica bacterium CG11_big_fil_rev_8_21_14_0_20_45_26]PIW63791.1 MAG: DNA repair protein RecN [Candidatus Omnitrophica bacterium CG12_big_fil_rev_8_21_14_0_65_45_16]